MTHEISGSCSRHPFNSPGGYNNIIEVYCVSERQTVLVFYGVISYARDNQGIIYVFFVFFPILMLPVLARNSIVKE